MLARLVPADVHVHECFEDRPIDLFPSERAAIATAVRKRQDEFTSVRACARDALARLGFAPAALVPGPAGAPTWPPGVTGSMTHCAGYRGAAVALTSKMASLGIDAEPNAPMPDGVLDLISGPAERHALLLLPQRRVAWDRVLFSAKEAIYKCWYPLTERWLGFEDVEVEIEPSGAFRAHLLVPGPIVDEREVRELAGRWGATDAHVLTAIWLPLSSS